MHLGVDLGTTRTLVAAADRGNYPVVTFFDGEDDPHGHFPSVVAERGGRLVHGFEALTVAAEGGPVMRSFKRLLARPDVSPDQPVTVGRVTVPLTELLTSYVSALRDALATSSIGREFAGDVTPDGRLASEVVIAVPAHAHSAQRFLTLDAFRRAGFTVTGMLNEPSAAGFEYTHHRGNTVTSKRTRIIVYDLGGGTFDASLVSVEGTNHEVLGSLGLNDLGGDDFDAVLASCALAAGDLDPSTLSPAHHRMLLDECREAKEHLSPQSKRIALEAGDMEVLVRTDDFYGAAEPLVQRSIEAMAPLISGLDECDPDLTEIAGIYLVGGASGLPLVPRRLRDRFGRRVHRSPHPAASTAIGLAIAADPEAGFTLQDRLSRGFGVFREAADGRQLSFDALLDGRDSLPETGELAVSRRYRAAHNIGCYRFVEYTALDEHGRPRGALMPFAEVAFPFDPTLQAASGSERPLTGVGVERRDGGPLIEETYVVDANGMIQVRIDDLDTGYSRSYRLQTARA